MEAAPVCSPRLRLPGSSFSLIDVIHQLEGGHASALSDATNCEQETTGVILICSRGRVKFVIPGGPGHRPAVGLALRMMSFCLSITSRWMAPAFSTVCEVQNEPTTGSRVTLEVERSGRGSLDTVVCMRAPLNFVQHSMDLHAVLNQHRRICTLFLINTVSKNSVQIQRKAVASLAARVQEQVHRMEDNNHATQQRLNATVACLLAMPEHDDADSKHSTSNRSSLGSEEVERLKKEAMLLNGTGDAAQVVSTFDNARLCLQLLRCGPRDPSA
jgi:hypothetical protein